MLSLDTAQKLKNAGLKWEPQEGDYFYNLKNELKVFDYTIPITLMVFFPEGAADKFVFAPRLDQLLAEIEKRGYLVDSVWHLPVKDEESPVMKYACILTEKSNRADDFNPAWDEGGFKSREEAAAQALLWIMEQEAKACE